VQAVEREQPLKQDGESCLAGNERSPRMRSILGTGGAGLLSIGLLLLSSSSSFGQAPVTKWSSVAKATNSACSDGFVVEVVEQPGTMKLTFFFNGRKASETTLNLSADGSGKVEITGIIGRVVYEVASGTGKRPINSFQIGGVCRWSWIPS
jgi:hypothetical protein